MKCYSYISMFQNRFIDETNYCKSWYNHKMVTVIQQRSTQIIVGQCQ